ncbi:MAG: GtrA family protein [Candidatus Vogelbacteria bacterium]|nr:GtrA family protein [Candidatus Vogelbacteria bacterium]
MASIFTTHKLVVKYITTGVLSALIDFVLLYVFTEYLFNHRYILSAVFAFTVSLSVAFIIQKYWTFGDYSEHNIHGQLFSYLLTVIFILLLNLLILFLLVQYVHLYYLFAQLLAICVTGTVGFVINVRNVFHKPYYPSGVVVAAGIFPPDVGGPASHIYRLAEEMAKLNVRTTIVTYSHLRHDTIEGGYDVIRVNANLPLPIRGIVYLILLFTSAVNYPVIFAQDITSTGLPALIVKRFLPQKKLIIRIGGDLLWERYVESGRTKLSVADFYRAGNYKRDLIFRLGKTVMCYADKIIVPADFLKDIYVRYYKVSEEKIVVLKNPLPDINLCDIVSTSAERPSERIILFAGRFIKFKNVSGLINSFISIYDEIKPVKLLLIGEGPERDSYLEIINKSPVASSIEIIPTLPHEELLGKIKKASLCVCASWTEPNSNFILESLSLGRPVLLTRSNGLSVNLPEELLFSYDNQKEFADKMKYILVGGYDASQIKKLVCSGTEKLSWEYLMSRYKKILNF